MTHDVLSFGHGTLDPSRFVELLRSQAVHTLVDVRTYPGSRHHPQVNQESMSEWLGDAGIRYVWLLQLGGRRGKNDEAQRDVFWNHPSFRNYAGHTRSEEFDEGISNLMYLARQHPTAFMCSESVWWKCHRRIISDYLVGSSGWSVGHLMHDGSVRDHTPPPEMRVLESGNIVYDGGQLPLCEHHHEVP